MPRMGQIARFQKPCPKVSPDLPYFWPRQLCHIRSFRSSGVLVCQSPLVPQRYPNSKAIREVDGQPRFGIHLSPAKAAILNVCYLSSARPRTRLECFSNYTVLAIGQSTTIRRSAAFLIDPTFLVWFMAVRDLFSRQIFVITGHKNVQ